jgi:hypothetical protein
MLQWQAGMETNLSESGYRYEHHRPEKTLFYQLVKVYDLAFAVQLAPQGTELSKYIR